MSYSKGERVIHPAKRDWGLGEVLEECTGDTVVVFFANAGRKVLKLSMANLQRVSGADAESALLDNLSDASRSADGRRHLGLPEAVQQFRRLFPLGFEDPQYLEYERDYKVAAHELTVELLDKEPFCELLAGGQHEEACRRALKVVNRTNIIFPQEKMALKDGLKNAASCERFASDLYNMLYGNDQLCPRFERFSATLTEIGAAKWTIVSYFLFLRFPDRYMFLKPTVSQNAAGLMGFELNYRPDLNWLTYKALLDFSGDLRARMGQLGLHPRDMIDVQSFMFSVDPTIYGNYLKELAQPEA